jgi:GNAT superfamily N-acetyltransferase
MAHEKGIIKAWINEHFHAGWGEEFETSCCNKPVTTFIATRGGKLAGFACYEVTCRAFFGPAGVIDDERGRGIGRALLLHAMHGLRELGYAYGIIGCAGPVEFYIKTLGGIVIEESSPGIYPATPIE